MGETALLELKGLQVAYGGIQAVKGIDLVVRSASSSATSSAPTARGKTTTLKGHHRPAADQERIDPLRRSGHLPASRHSCSFAAGCRWFLEGRGVFGALSIEENLAMGAYTRNDRAAIRADVERVYGLFPG